MPYAQRVQTRIDAALDRLQSDGDLAAAKATLAAIFDEAILYSPDNQPDALREADFAWRLVSQLKSVGESNRAGFLKYLRANPTLAQTLVFLLKTDGDIAGTYKMLDALRERHADILEQYATLAVAVSAVHHAPFKRQINENATTSAVPTDIFDFYVRNEPRMFFGVRNVPAELLEYVVDTTASIDEMNWALDKYAGDKDVGKRFFDIAYDYDHFLKGTTKSVTLAGFTLPNILRYGGVCADQAYFATEVGKSIGVPTAYDVGASGEVGHAWVGFLQTDGRRGWWNFDEGRYEAYRGVRGNVIDPVTRKEIPDSYVSLLGELIGTKPVNRFNAVALTDAAVRLIRDDAQSAAVDPPTDASNIRPTARKADTATELALIESALRECAGYAPAWSTVRDLAVANKLNDADKSRWADTLLRLGAKKYPDFTLAILGPMISTIPDPMAQDRIWSSKVFPLFESRFDLAASVRMQQAALWEAHDQPEKAGICYLDVIDRYANAGPFVIEALKGAEKQLIQSGRSDRVVRLYEQTWAKIQKPREMAGQFTTQSNWYRVGKLYDQKLLESGDQARAAAVKAEISKVTGLASP